MENPAASNVRDAFRSALSPADVVTTEELARRPSRAPDYAAESRALLTLADAMAVSPQAVLKKLVTLALELCRAESAGVSMLEEEDGREVFRWPAIAGSFARNIGGAMARDASPCGTVLDRNASLLFRHPERSFPYPIVVDPPMTEALLAPFHADDRPIGTVWVINHTEGRSFDAEDARLLASLARFAASAAHALAKARGEEQTESLLVAQRDVLEMIARASPLADVLDALCRIAEERAGGPVRAAILLVDPSGKRLVTGAAPSLPEAYRRAVDSVPIDPHVGTSAAAAARRETVVTADIDTAPSWAKLGHLSLELGLKAAWSTPILASDGRVLGTFGTYFLETREPTAGERRLTEVLARTAGLAIERRQADDLLRASEARYRAIVEATPECVKLVASDGTFLQINPAGLRMLEAEEQAVVGRCVYDVVAPEFRDAYRAFNERVCRGEGGTLEFDILGANGTRRHMETTAVPLPSPGAGDAFVQLAVARDVTARVTSARALDESRARLDYAVRLSGVGFWYCDLPFAELEWDERAKDHFWLPADVRVTIDTFYERLHPDDREPTRRTIEECIASRTPYDMVYRTVHPETRAEKWIRALGGTVNAPDGSPSRFDGVTIDVTVLKRAEEALRDADRRKNDFLALLAHELRNPLAPLRNGVHVLRLAAGDPTALAQAREMMERQLAHMVRLIDDLLDVARISRNKMELRRERLVLSDVIASAVETARPAIDDAAHELSVQLPAAPIFLHGDFTRLAQVFSNLLTNSAKYTERGGRIRVTAEVRAEVVEVVVHDTGIGIPAEAIPSIFDMFSQVDRPMVRAAGGLGIGLALVKGLVEMHGGSVAASSAGSGSGSVFRVVLPVLAPAPTAPEAEPRQGRPVPSDRSQRVLVVDDNRDSALSLAKLLGLLGHEVRTAHDGYEACEAAEAFRPDAILMDVGMPRLNGHEATRLIRKQAWGGHPFIVALTGWGQDVDREQSRSAGCDAHLVKPVDVDDLVRLLESTPAQRPIFPDRA